MVTIPRPTALAALWAAFSVVLICVVLTVLGLFAWKHNQDQLDRQQTQLKIEQDRRQADMCRLIDVLAPTSGPSPTTERGKTSADGLNAYRAQDCPPRR